MSSVPGPADLLAAVIAQFQVAYPEVTVRLFLDEAIVKLEYGVAHVALRAGAPPQEPDNIAQKLMRIGVGLYAAPSYVEQFGLPKDSTQFSAHRFVGHDHAEHGSPFNRWLRAAVPEERIMTRSNDHDVLEAAVFRGVGIGFADELSRVAHPDLIEVMEPLDEWAVDLWVVSHVDLHHTAKVQAFLKILKEVTKTWRQI